VDLLAARERCGAGGLGRSDSQAMSPAWACDAAEREAIEEECNC